MIISPPLIIDKEQIDILIERAWKSLDEGMSNVKEKGLWESAPI
jgi:putrescine aminotransferase